jgi:EmrB/QacA subfamily drug resistance transporter
VNIALPSAQLDLGFSDGNRQWVVTAYALAFGSLLLLGGRIADLFGRKPVFLAGLIGFAVASAIGGAAWNFESLVAARVLQGVFGALLAPAGLALLTTTFTDPGERGKAFGIYGAIAGGGGAVGLLLGGTLTEYASWRWCLYVNLPIALVASVGAVLWLRHSAIAVRPKLDLPGTVTVSAALFSLVFGFANAETHDWDSPMVWGFLAAGAALLGLFGWLQTRVVHPLLPLRVLLDRNRGGAFVTLFVMGAGMFGVFLFLTYYLSQILGYTPVKTGLAFLPMIGVLSVTATTVSSVLLPRFGPRPLIPTGLLIASGGMLWLTGINLDSTYAAHILPPLMVLGLGLGLAIAPAMSIATLGVSRQDSGVASATVSAMQQIGGSIGTALLSTMASGAAASYLVGRATDPVTLGHAAIESYHTAFQWSGGFFLAGAILCALLLRSGVPQQDPDAEPVIAH